jgi:protein-S-isoprenylcysteine O-methyltransferase Ste14
MPEILANAIALIHAALIALVVGGALVALTPRVVARFPRWLIAAYLISVTGTLLSDLFLGECILTQWERTLRERALAGSAYSGTFLQHYFGFLPSGLAQPSHFPSYLGVVLGVTAWAGLQLRRRSRDLG